MHNLLFRTELDDQNRIRVPLDLARQIPPHAPVLVELRVEGQSRRGHSNGALNEYMHNPIDMPGVLPFDRDALYSDPD